MILDVSETENKTIPGKKLLIFFLLLSFQVKYEHILYNYELLIYYPRRKGYSIIIILRKAFDYKDRLSNITFLKQ